MISYDTVFDWIGQIQRATTSDALLEMVEGFVGQSGATGLCVAVYPKAGSAFRNRFRNDRLANWLDHFDDAGYVSDCAVSARINSSPDPFLWQDVAKRVPRGTRAGRVLDAARDFDVTDGLIVPVHTREGDRGVVGIMTEPGGERDLDRPHLTMLSLAFHAQFERLERRAEPSPSRLSRREREVLQWFARGKTSEDVASILGISAATVMFHYRNAANRYGTLNRTHTVTEAFRRGALNPSEM